jgi:HEPN domain-containing protein
MQDDPVKLAETRVWVVKAHRDLQAAEVLLTQHNPLLDVVACHCQQSAEKAIKAYLTCQDIIFPKTHNLVALLALIIPIEPGFNDWREMAETLTPWATEFRYPGDVAEPERAEVEQAYALTEAFLRFVSQKMSDGVRP